ncbi:hypothetical protein CHLRE_13g606000v5 [Chlamydomonas reinhardtii]|uniref:Tr-type G domain-containing protein n=1 Tax=Chlamydomonas reinhardtii TaxID=3055 RepID=A0A2K3D1G0_CHLRE|nr:uncharacterized protein CHLRE_13g606000v5 [Chlamydomonas reinhardtii]PNW74376.1 hypothetical protein CHLRE_13g606000v5 [Chlamydomonas reinhardtii]
MLRACFLRALPSVVEQTGLTALSMGTAGALPSVATIRFLSASAAPTARDDRPNTLRPDTHTSASLLTTPWSSSSPWWQRRGLHTSTPGQAAGAAAADGPAARDPSTLRNFAIIAHIDHGKTTLMDRLLAACGHGSAEDRAMDSHSLEKERGITILAKVTSFTWGGYHLNAVDTPGHADFGGEVERVLGLVDGCVLLVDAAEGPLAQTKYVVGKALARGLRPIVLLNKVDRPAATPERCAAVANSLLDLFVAAGASDEQLDFPLLYASAKQGWASRTLPPGGAAPPGDAGMRPLLETIAAHVPPPATAAMVGEPFAMGVTWIERDPYIGRIATGRVAAGRVRLGDKVRVLSHETGGPVGEAEYKVTRIGKRAGMAKIQLDEAVAGDIVSIAGAGSAAIADTIANPSVTTLLDPGRVDPPTLAMVFGPNDSPLAGRAGKALTGRAIGERLQAEAETSVSLRVGPAADGSGSERYEVQARGELQLGVLIESMRREGAELAVSPPQVLLRRGEGGQVLEPLEEVMVEVADELAGSVIEALSLRKAELSDMTPMPGTGKQRLTFVAPSRGLIGFKSVFVNLTRGEGILNRVFLQYAPHKGPMEGVRKGVMVSVADGRASAYALGELQSRGTFFVTPGADVYGGMIVGEHTREEDLDVNPVKEKKATNVRSVQSDDKVSLGAPRLLSLEDAIGYVAQDELIEVTPAAVRLRKEVLDAGARRTKAKRAQQAQQ